MKKIVTLPGKRSFVHRSSYGGQSGDRQGCRGVCCPLRLAGGVGALRASRG